MFSFLNDLNNYDERLVERTEVGSFTVSTVYTSDEGYETAILESGDVHPVDRYEDRIKAVEGHKKWIKFLQDGNRIITKLGGFGGLVEDEIIQLEN